MSKFIDNSFKSAIKTGSWKNGGAKAYAEIARLGLTDPEAILKEAYLIGPKCKISIDRGYITPFAKTGLKYPHHSVKNGKLVVNIPGLKAAYSRAKQMGIYKGEVKEHLQRHYKQLGIYDSSQMAVDDKITENFEYIESSIDNEYLNEGYSELNSIDKELNTTYSEACKDLESAREFVSRVKDLANEYDANFFIVTDGASGIHNNGNPAVKHARDCQIEWEKENGYDPDEDWSQDVKPEDINEYEDIEESFNDIESMIYESTKTAMSCNNPQELLKYMMANYKPGFVHLTKKAKGMAGTPDVRYPLGNDYQFTAAFNLQSPSRIEVNRVGTSWDFCELEREWFHRHGYQFSVFYVELYNPKKPTQHTFLVYYDQRKYWWFEFGWNEKIGIKAYDDLSILLTDVMNNIRKFNNDYKNNFIIRWLTNKPKTGITAPEYLKYARNSVIINPKYLPKRLNDEKLFDQVRESYEEDIDLLDESMDYYEEKTSKKEQHRIDKFKQRHGFIPDKNNPNKGTIETDIIGKDGKKMRVPFEITNSRDLGQAASGKVDESDPRYMDIRMNRQILKRKPAISNTTFKHEEGHLDYKLNPEKYAKMKKDIQDMLSTVSNDLNDHGQNVEEYIADNYAKQHSGYSIKGFDQMINSLRYTNDQIKKDLVTFEKKLLHNSANSIKVVSDLTDEIHKKSMELNMIMIPKLNTNKKSLMEIYNNKEKYKDLTDAEKQTMIEWIIKTIQKTEKTINDYKTSIKNIKSYIDNIKNQLKDQNKKELNNRKGMALQGLNQAKKENENEMNLRHQFAHNYESYEEDLSFLDNDIFTERWNELEKNHMITEADEEKKEDQKEEENKEEDILDKPVQEDPPSIEDADSEDNNEEDSIPKDDNILDEPVEDDIDKQEAESEEILSDNKPDEELNNEEDIPEETPADNKPMSMPKKTDAAEEDKNGKRRKKLYIEFINWCKEFNDKNSFGSVFDQDVFHNTYPFVPDEMRYFYRISNPLVCVLSGDLTFFSLCELRKLNANNSQMNKYLIFAATEKDYRIFNMEDRQVYLANQENGSIKLQQSLGDTFDTYLQNMINHGDILNGPIPETYGNEKKEDTKEETIKEESVNIFEDFLFNN